jgi:hypothetical protein
MDDDDVFCVCVCVCVCGIINVSSVINIIYKACTVQPAHLFSGTVE